MRPNQKRSRGLPPLVIRSLGVLAITLMAMTTSLSSSVGVPTCERVCDRIAWTDCPPFCVKVPNMKCLPYNTSRWCFDNCVYTLECTTRSCVPEGGGPDGKRVECTRQGQQTPSL